MRLYATPLFFAGVILFTFRLKSAGLSAFRSTSFVSREEANLTFPLSSLGVISKFVIFGVSYTGPRATSTFELSNLATDA